MLQVAQTYLALCEEGPGRAVSLQVDGYVACTGHTPRNVLTCLLSLCKPQPPACDQALAYRRIASFAHPGWPYLSFSGPNRFVGNSLDGYHEPATV